MLLLNERDLREKKKKVKSEKQANLSAIHLSKNNFLNMKRTLKRGDYNIKQVEDDKT